MLELGRNKWLHFADIAKDIPGREDPPETTEECWKLLREQFGKRLSGHGERTADRARKTTGQITAARVRQASAGGQKVGTEIREKLARQEVAIDRLLAFVPTRAAALPVERIQQIARDLGARITDLLDRAVRVVVTISDEVDPETEACHRITVNIDTPGRFDAASLAEAAIGLHRFLAEQLEPEEYRAVRLVVDS